MQVIDKGTGKPQLAVVGSIHGDEPVGKKAINRLKDELEFKKPVRFIIANEEALEQGKRFLDTDLNRSFPGDKNSSSHEKRLAAELLDKLDGMTVLDLHSTHSHPEPFAVIKDLEDVERMKLAGVENAVYFEEESGSLIENVDGLVVEAGHQGSEKAVDNAVEVAKNFLAAHDAIEGEPGSSEPQVFREFETVEGDYEFLAENFKEVEEGEVYARSEDEELVAEQSFYPVLMSTNGYEGKLGFKAEKLEL